MLKYIGRRLLLFIPTLFLISVLIFFVIQLPPGDYVTSYVAAMEAEGEIFTAEEIAALRERYGLDDPWFIQYFNWMKGIITEGDFGYSFHYSLDVWDVIMQRLWLTLGVSFTILIFQYGVSLPIGIYCANHQYSVGDYLWSFIGFIGTATPNFLLGIILTLLYQYRLDKTYRGTFIGLFFIGCFGSRFLIEFIKEPQVGFENDMVLNMGQWLSIPFILIGVGFLVYAYIRKQPARAVHPPKQKKKSEPTHYAKSLA
jgi:ABC-type dipeptide/oligopeptide/nickel transport system permease component